MISLNGYKERYSGALIIVVMCLILFIRDVIRILEDNNIHTYLPMNNNPAVHGKKIMQYGRFFEFLNEWIVTTGFDYINNLD